MKKIDYRIKKIDNAWRVIGRDGKPWKAKFKSAESAFKAWKSQRVSAHFDKEFRHKMRDAMQIAVGEYWENWIGDFPPDRVKDDYYEEDEEEFPPEVE